MVAMSCCCHVHTFNLMDLMTFLSANGFEGDGAMESMALDQLLAKSVLSA